MKKYIITFGLFLMSYSVFAQQSQPQTSPQVNDYYKKQIQSMDIANLPLKDKEKFEKGYADFANSAKMTPVPKIQLPSKEDINKKLTESGNR